MPDLEINNQTNINAPQIQEVSPVSGSDEVVSSPPPPAKKSFPKFLLIIPLLLIFALVVFGISRLISSRRIAPSANGEITWWGLWEDDSTMNPLIEEYQQKNPSVKIKYVSQSPQDYRERLINSLAKGTGPDIFQFHNSWTPMIRPELDPLPASVMSSSDFSQTFYPVAVSDLTSGTGILGIPLEYDSLALYINENIFEKAAKSPPKTWDEFRQLAINLTVKDDKGIIQQSGTALGRVENVDHWPEIVALMMMENGVKMGNPTGKLANDALTFFSLFSRVDRVWDETLPPSTIAFAAGKVAMYFGTSWRAHEIKQQNPRLRFKTVPVPQIPQEESEKTNLTYATYWVQGVWTRSKLKKQAWDFLKYMSEKDTLEKFYQNASKIRSFGEAYPRVDMASLISSDPILVAFVAQAPFAKSWYLASRTFDGPTGINSQINKYFEDAVNATVRTGSPGESLNTVSSGVNQVLSRYGITTSGN